MYVEKSLILLLLALCINIFYLNFKIKFNVVLNVIKTFYIYYKEYLKLNLNKN